MKSGLFYPNRFVRITLQALAEVIGSSGMRTIYSHAGLAGLVEQLPADNMEKEFGFSDFSSLFGTMQTILGERGANTLALRAGRITFKEAMSFFKRETSLGNSPGTGPLGAHTVNLRLNRLANFINSVSDQQCSVESTPSSDVHRFFIQTCPVCTNRSGIRPVCTFFEGLLSEAVSAFSGGLDYQVHEMECMACGADACQFEITLNESTANTL